MVLQILRLALMFCVFGNLAFAATDADMPGFKSSLLGKPTDWSGSAAGLFAAKYDYPDHIIDMAQQPWLTLDPRDPRQRGEYYNAIISYGLSAYTKDIFGSCPTVAPGWYHAPWLTLSGGNTEADIQQGRIGAGREPICGLTAERSAPVGSLHVNQRTRVQNWAVGIFNAPGGYLLGRIWRNRAGIDLSERVFPEGTFIIKFLLTEADTAAVPYLTGAPTWEANIYAADRAAARKTKPLRLLQIDFAVKDKRMANETGWVFGSFLYYNPSPAINGTWRDHLVPIGLMWGNDPGNVAPGTYKQQALTVEVAQLRSAGKLFDPKVRQEFGWHDRVNGPVDNPDSSCLSCHGTAQVHSQLVIKQFITPSLKPGFMNDQAKMLWFRNIKSGNTFTFSPDELNWIDQGSANTLRADWTPTLMKDFLSTDFSLQIRMAIENARLWEVQKAAFTLQRLTSLFSHKEAAGDLSSVVRDLGRESRRIESIGTQN